MKKWTWTLLLVGLVIILFLWTAREGFQDTATLKGPPYGNADYPTITSMMSNILVRKLQDAYEASHAGQGKPDPNALDGQRKLVDGTISDVMGDFHTSVYQPAKEPLKASDVDTFLASRATAGFLADNRAEIKSLLKSYFVDQPAGSANAAQTDKQAASSGYASASGYADILAGLKQKAAPSSDPTQKCPTNFHLENGICLGAETVELTCTKGIQDPNNSEQCISREGGNTTVTQKGCPPGSVKKSPNDKVCYKTAELVGTPSATGDHCKDEVATKQWSDVSAACKASVTGTSPANATPPSGNTTGGSSLIPQPNSGGVSGASLTGGGGASKGNLWGPAYVGMGDNSEDGLGMRGPRDYPTLIGPQPKESTMIPGAGIAQPSIHVQLAKKGALPSSGSTASDKDSQFFGTSRMPGASTTPGDQDMYPGYFGGAGSTAFTASTGSSKTDPIPFLADFSAFLK